MHKEDGKVKETNCNILKRKKVRAKKLFDDLRNMSLNTECRYKNS